VKSFKKSAVFGAALAILAPFAAADSISPGIYLTLSGGGIGTSYSAPTLSTGIVGDLPSTTIFDPQVSGLTIPVPVFTVVIGGTTTSTFDATGYSLVMGSGPSDWAVDYTGYLLSSTGVGDPAASVQNSATFDLETTTSLTAPYKYTDTLTVLASTPEPSSLALFGTGLAGLAMLIARKRLTSLTGARAS
jgi:hypothetical protein